MGPSPTIPDDPGGLLWKGELGGSNTGGQNPNFNPPYGGGSPFGNFGGGGSGGFFATPGYANFSGYDPMSAGLRKRMGSGGVSMSPAGGYGAPGPSVYGGGAGAMAPSGYGAPGASAYGGGAAPAAASGAPPDPWSAAWGAVQGGNADIGQNNRFVEGLIGGRGAGTQFDPNGDPAVLSAMQNYLTGLGGQQEQSAVLGAGLDNPNADMYSISRARMMARQGAMNNTANQIGQFRAQAAQQHQQLIDSLLSNLYGSNLALGNQNNAYSNMNAMNQRFNGGQGLGGMLGTLGGDFFGPLAGMGAGALGKELGWPALPHN